MAFDSAVLSLASSRLKKSRREAQKRADSLRELAYQREPNLVAIDQELQKTMSDLLGASLGRASGQTIPEIRAKNQRLQAERREILLSLELSPEQVDNAPTCTICGDSGWVNRKMCQCLITLCEEEQARELSTLLYVGDQSFEHFRLDYYSDENWVGQGSPRERAKINLDFCRHYSQNFSRFPVHNLYLTGAIGLGKTYLSACIAQTVSKMGFSVVYQTSASLFSQFELKKFNNDATNDHASRLEAHRNIKRFLECDLLILDDLGSELTNNFISSVLYQLVNDRLVRHLHTVISSNLSVREIATRYSPQVGSRIEGEYEILHFFGDDIRVAKKTGNFK